MRRIFFLLFWLVELPIAAVGALLLVFWFWSGTDQSLASALGQASRYLPSGQSLVVEGVRGSLRQGGHIGMLRWESNGLLVQAHQIELAWQPKSLLNRRLQLDTLNIAELSITGKSPAAGSTPLDDVTLPFEVDLHFSVDKLRWAGPPALEASTLRGRYQYDQNQHLLALDQAHVADGQYQARATLLATAPLTLDLQVQGKVQAPLGARQITLDASATLRGPLAGPGAVLDLLGQLQPAKPVPSVRPEPAKPLPSVRPEPVEGLKAKLSPNEGMRANVSAQLSPWAAQPVLRAQATFNQFNLAALWPQAPQTLLTGNAQVEPRRANWLARINLTNRLPGPWDKGRLPVDSARALVEFAAGRWNIQSLNLESAGGRIQAQGRLEDAASVNALSGWQVQAQLQNIDPAALHSQLAPVRLEGEIKVNAAQQVAVFDTLLRPSPTQGAASPLRGLRLQSVLAKGRWDGGWLQLQELNVQTDDAKLQGRFDLQPATRAMRGQLELAFPGALAKASGQLAPQEGAGDFSLQASDAGKAMRWLAALPQAPQALAQYALQGQVEATLQWQGGWQALLDGRGAEPTLQSSLRVPRLDIRAPGEPVEQALRLRNFQADASGRLSTLSLTTSGEVSSGTRRLSVQAQAVGGRKADGDWQASVTPLRLRAEDSLRPGPWILGLRQALTLDWKPARQGGTLSSTAGEAELSGPVPGVATLAWEPVRWSFGERKELLSRGQLRGVGLGWLELLANTQLANLRLSGNMLFDADWDLAAADTLKLRAALVRRSGDLQLQTDNLALPAAAAGAGAPPTINAGVKDARISITADGDNLRAALRWDSERAGEAQAEFSTRITRGTSGWDWPADSPLRATVQARLPQVGVWSVLAPPGWRMRGTLDASLALAGTRAAPQWNGSLQADDLGLRSVVDGIEFANGRLRASVQGQRLEIAEFSLQGAGGASGGELRATGFALWLPDTSGKNPALTRVRMELNATAQALRVSARADRRLAVSGTLQARLDNARLNIEGALKADQALFILPDETAPSLGDDVVVRGATLAPKSFAGPPQERLHPLGGPGEARAGGVDPIASADSAASASRNTAGARIATNLSVRLDFGPDFRVQGRGITTRLAGSVQLRSSMLAGEAPRLTGEVRTVLGSYKAYGQQLDVEQGVLRFTGVYDNPSLDILAIRPNLSQRVGVQITGTALSPRVRLYSEPELPQAEKLAWLVLGRSGANGGAEAAVLQQAAMALLGRNGQGLSGGLASSLGLDELSFSGSASNADGRTTSATVTLGKRLSRNFYVAYERSLAGTLGTFSIFYDLSSRFTLRARTGEQSAVDLIFTIAYD